MKNKILKVFFNASVILSGFNSPSGGSAKLLILAKKRKLIGLISEIVLDEVKKHSEKIGYPEEKIKKCIESIFPQILPPPRAQTLNKYNKLVIDTGDSHVLASTEESKTDYLVTLDAKHLLILKNSIKKFKIVSPKELIEFLS